MQSDMTYRRGTIDDLANLRMARDLSVTPESVEFNVVGAGHEFWIAIEEEQIVGLTVLARTASSEYTIVYLHISGAQKSRGIGSALIKAVIDSNPRFDFVVVPFHGTEEFYRRLGFAESGKWEMRKPKVQLGVDSEAARF